MGAARVRVRRFRSPDRLRASAAAAGTLRRVTSSADAPSLTLLRFTAALVAVASVLQTVLGIAIAVSDATSYQELHGLIGMAAAGVAVVAAGASIAWARHSGNRGLMMHAIGVAVLAIIQVWLGEEGAREIHMALGVLILAAAIALAALAYRKPGRARPAA